MSADRRQQIADRWREIDRELAELWAGRLYCNPPEREAELLMEQDALEHELGRLASDEP